MQWRPNDDLRVESQQLRYRKLIQWPRLHSLMAFGWDRQIQPE
ncbi:hypothetical protein [Pseudomonas capeferrum]